jgi:hypothetical protein
MTAPGRTRPFVSVQSTGRVDGAEIFLGAGELERRDGTDPKRTFQFIQFALLADLELFFGRIPPTEVDYFENLSLLDSWGRLGAAIGPEFSKKL